MTCQTKAGLFVLLLLTAGCATEGISEPDFRNEAEDKRNIPVMATSGLFGADALEFYLDGLKQIKRGAVERGDHAQYRWVQAEIVRLYGEGDLSAYSAEAGTIQSGATSINTPTQSTDQGFINVMSLMTPAGGETVRRVQHHTYIQASKGPSYTFDKYCYNGGSLIGRSCSTSENINCDLWPGISIGATSTHAAWDSGDGSGTASGHFTSSHSNFCKKYWEEIEQDVPYNEGGNNAGEEETPTEDGGYSWCLVRDTYWTDTGEIISRVVLYCW